MKNCTIGSFDIRTALLIMLAVMSVAVPVQA
ncbi:MAG: hypothetical protein ACI9I0_001576 [Rhodoferax sp.]|jgi:hypothetical protein